jgi:hypothetical protein
MLLESSPLNPSAEEPPATAARRGNSRRGAAAPDSAATYARVRDEVEVGAGNERAAATASANGAKKLSLWQNGAFGFGDLIDVINPLQHIPIVATVYRNLSGDQIGVGARVVGGALWGRIGGFVAGIVNSVVEWFTGKDIGDHIYSAIWGKADGNAVAQQTPQPRSAAPAASDAAREIVPLSGADSADQERHSAVTPDHSIAHRIESSYYRRADEASHGDARPPRVRRRA